ncbi:MAG: Gfo/Idh/MocA family oxidoreductase [Armatimonadetes bacterium]|nr:Gfo/Idh/MocA family oxidoreductase [Armatimonadota bacterium]MDW8154621.1 Gfo/Idh/MocA family oxidoreductase [Armatimonadota bacterium]
MNRIRICLVGAGRAGLVHGYHFAFRIPEAELVAVVDEDLHARMHAAKALRARPFASLEEALEGVAFEGVCVATPTFTHRDLVVRAAEAGKHVLCEKPLALEVPQALEMIRAAERAGVVLQVGFMRRFDAEFQEARARIVSGELGRLLLIRSTTRGPGLPPPWAWDPKKGIGLLAEVTSHDFDTLRWLSGSEYRSVFARVAARKATHLLAEYPDFYDVALVSVEMEDGTLGSIEGACPVDYGYDSRVEILGTDGMISIGGIRKGSWMRVTREGQVLHEAVRSWRDRYHDAYLAEDEHFVACIQRSCPPEVTGWDGLRALEATLAAIRSAAAGLPQPVERVEAGL